MKKTITLLLIVLQLMLLSVPSNAFENPLSEYERNYKQFVDYDGSLRDLYYMDFVITRNEAYAKKAPLSQLPDPNRTDYFDIIYGPYQRNKLDIHHLKGDKLRPVIFYIHSGGWISGDKDTSRFAAPTWVALGYTVVAINYRYAPQDPHPAQIDDCARALKWVMDNIQNYGGDPTKIALTGLSAGGHLAALLATDVKWHKKYNIDMKNVVCWIPMSGMYDFNLKESYYNPIMEGFNNALLDNPAKKDDASPVNHITGNEPPCLIMHGADDWLIPRTNAIEFYNKLIAKGVRADLQVIEGQWHSSFLSNYGEAGHKPTRIMNRYLAIKMPTVENNMLNYLNDYSESKNASEKAIWDTLIEKLNQKSK